MINLPSHVDAMVNCYVIYVWFSTIFDKVLIEAAITVIIHSTSIYRLLTRCQTPFWMLDLYKEQNHFLAFYKVYYLIMKESFKLQLKVIPCTLKLAFFFPQLDVQV